MTKLTADLVGAAYGALMSLDREKVLEYWDENIRFEMPGNHQYAGWHEGIDDYLHFTTKLVEASGGAINSEPVAVIVDAEQGYSVDIFRNTGFRAHASTDAVSYYDRLEVDGLHVLKWADGKVVEGRGALFGDSATRSNLWWSPLGPDGRRTAL